MRDVGVDLRHYFDETVERITTDDVLIQAATRTQRNRIDARWWRRPRYAVAAGFGGAVVLVGSVLVGGWLLGWSDGTTEPSPAGTPEPLGGVAGSVTWIWLLLGGALATVAAIFLLRWRAVSRIERERGGAMQTLDKEAGVAVDSRIEQLTKQNRTFMVVIAFLVLVAGGLGAWLGVELASDDGATELRAQLDDANSSVDALETELAAAKAHLELANKLTVIGGGEPSARQLAMLDLAEGPYLDAWNNADANAIGAFFTPIGDFRNASGVYWPHGTPPELVDADPLASLTSMMTSMELTSHPGALVWGNVLIMSGEWHNTLVQGDSVAVAESISVITFTDEGDLLIRRHVVVEPSR